MTFTRRGRSVHRRTWAGCLIALSLLAPVSAFPADPRPVVKMCVDGRQTQDPSSPPCVAFYDGEDPTATWQGVTADEVTVVVALSAAHTVDRNGPSTTPPGGTYCDVDLTDCDGDGQPDEESHAWVRVAQAYSRYFNSRFQTYGRHVRVYLYFSTASSPAARRADAADNHESLTPFSVVDQTQFGGYHESYASAAAARSMMVFGQYRGFSNAFFRHHAPMVWSYWPDVESAAHLYSSYVCTKVAPTLVSSGPSKGEPRRYALYHADDPEHPGAALFALFVRQGLSSCGVTIPDEDVFTFPYSGWHVDTEGDRSYALRNALAMKMGGYNTVLWAGGSENDTTKAADLIAYSPEWVVAGDGIIEGQSFGQSQGQRSWSNAWVQGVDPRVGQLQDDPAVMAYREAEPSGLDEEWASRFYREWFLLFTAIQVAGVTLTPANVEAGLRAMPVTTSTDPFTPSGGFPAGSFTYVKDGNESWYDSEAIAPDGSVGCYRLVKGGIRSSASTWSQAIDAGLGKRSNDGSADGQERVPSRDPCNGYQGSSSIRPGVPSIPNLSEYLPPLY